MTRPTSTTYHRRRSAASDGGELHGCSCRVDPQRQGRRRSFEVNAGVCARGRSTRNHVRFVTISSSGRPVPPARSACQTRRGARRWQAMTIWDALPAILRRWYVLLGAVLIGLLASYVAVSADGAYWSHAEVTFLAPTSAINPNALRSTSSDLIIAAGVVAKRVNGNQTWNQMADPAATIVGQGILDGSQVKLPDHGGQWSTRVPAAGARRPGERSDGRRRPDAPVAASSNASTRSSRSCRRASPPRTSSRRRSCRRSRRSPTCTAARSAPSR